MECAFQESARLIHLTGNKRKRENHFLPNDLLFPNQVSNLQEEYSIYEINLELLHLHAFCEQLQEETLYHTLQV